MLTFLQSVIRELEQTVRALSDQVKFLSMNTSSSNFGHPMQNRNSPGPSSNNNNMLPPSQLSHMLQQSNLPPPPQSYQQHTFQQPPQQQQQQPPAMHGPWFGPNIAAPQASHPTAPPPLPQQGPMSRATPPASGQSEEWDDAYLLVLGSQDTRQLRELLARSNPDVVMPLNGPIPLSQAVTLTLIHRVRWCFFIRRMTDVLILCTLALEHHLRDATCRRAVQSFALVAAARGNRAEHFRKCPPWLAGELRTDALHRIRSSRHMCPASCRTSCRFCG